MQTCFTNGCWSGEQGFTIRRDTYHITSEMNPENGVITHLHSMEFYCQEQGGPKPVSKEKSA